MKRATLRTIFLFSLFLGLFNNCIVLILLSVSNVDAGTKRRFVVYKADMSYGGFRQYHERIQTFLLWYIDAALFIDVDDDQWQYFNVYVWLLNWFSIFISFY